MTERKPEERIFTPANIVTMLRIGCVPIFVVAILSPWHNFIPDVPGLEAWKPIIATFIFILLSATDGVDGYLARSRNEVTNFGKFVDPLADKILVAAALLVLIELGVLPSWVALIILCREFIVSGLRMMVATKGKVVAASWYGKFKTVFQIIAIVMFLLMNSLHLFGAEQFAFPYFVLSWIVMAIALILTIVSMLDYFAKCAPLLGFVQSKNTADAAVSATKPMTAEDLLEAARKSGKTLATAESLTGGMIGQMLTQVPGSSDVFNGGIICYTNEVKIKALGVPAEIINTYGAVSSECAENMAMGARRATDADIAVAVTGIAGPTGEEPGKPVGTVYIGIADEEKVLSARYEFTGNRQTVREKTVQAALEMFATRL